MRTHTPSKLPRLLLTATAAGGILAAAITTSIHDSDIQPLAAEASSAYGAAATGTDPASPKPSVSSGGAIRSASGSNSGAAGTFSATGITVRAGAGMAEARVGNVTVAGESFGSVTATCRNGITSVKHSGKKSSKPNVNVAYGSGGGPSATGITVTITGAGDETAQTITAAVVRCGKGTPPPTSSEPTPDEPQPSPDKDEPTRGDSAQPDTDTEPGDAPIAPTPRLREGHHPVTG